MSPESLSVPDLIQVSTPTAVEPPAQPSTTEPQSITTQEEVEGFHIVRAIVRELISTKRVVMRDAMSYCAILLDDNNRKPICRLRFNNLEKLKIGLFNQDKEEEIFNIESPDDIYLHADRIRATVSSYLPHE